MYDASPAALGTVCPALPAVPKISKNLVAYMAGLLVTAPYCIETAIPAPQADANAFLKYPNLVSDAEFTAYLKRMLVEWYATAPKNDHRSPPRDEANGGGGWVRDRRTPARPCMD